MNWKKWPWILVLCFFGVLAGIPYTLSVIKDTFYESSFDTYNILIRALKEFFFILVPASLAGVFLSKKIGLSFGYTYPSIRDTRKNNIQNIIFLVTILGILLALPGIIGYIIFPENALGAGQNNPTPVEWLLRSASAAITEETAFRFGLMTSVAWIILKIKKDQDIYQIALWSGNIVAAIVGSAAHLPGILSADPINYVVIFSVMLFTLGAGIVLGWLYMRHGLWAALLCHFIADTFQHVLPRLM